MCRHNLQKCLKGRIEAIIKLLLELLQIIKEEKKIARYIVEDKKLCDRLKKEENDTLIVISKEKSKKNPTKETAISSSKKAEIKKQNSKKQNVMIQKDFHSKN